MIKIIDLHERSIKIVREEFENYTIDLWVSSIMRAFLKISNTTLEEFYIKNIQGLIPKDKDIYIFYFSKYEKINSFINELESEGHTDIKKSDIYLFRNDSLEKIY